MTEGKQLDAQNAYLVRLLKHGPRDNQMPVLQRLRAKEAEITRLRRCLAISGDGRIAELLTQLNDAQTVIEKMRAMIQILWSVGCGTQIPEMEAVVQEILKRQPSNCIKAAPCVLSSGVSC